MDQLPLQRILIFLPQAAAVLVAARLTEAGYLASVACSLRDLQAALGSENYHLVVTSRPDIDTVRNIKPLPVVNLEIFFHPDPQGTSPEIGTKQFDAKAFFRRVRDLTELATARQKHAVGKTAVPTAKHGPWLWRLFWLRQPKNVARLSS
jgi:hypothetical protein